MTQFLRTASVFCVAALTAACGSDDDSSNPVAMNPGTGGSMSDSGNTGGSSMDATGGAPAANPGSVVDTAVANEDFTQLVDALQAANLVDTLAGDGPFTVFAPTDEAFEAFEAANPGVLGSLSIEELTAVLTYHVVAGTVHSSDLVDSSIAPTLQGGYVNVAIDSGVSINDATVTTADIEASNGVIHVIDSVIVPPSDDIVATAVAAGDFTQLAAALKSTGLADVLSGESPFTVFAPTDAAFEAFEAANPGVLGGLTEEQLSDILLYHVTSGWVSAADLSDGMSIPTALEGSNLTVDLSDGVKVDSSTVTQTNILTSNGVIHVIDSILLPPSE